MSLRRVTTKAAISLFALTAVDHRMAMAAAGTSDSARGRVELVGELVGRSYFKDSPCRDIVDSELRSIGLPELGKKTVVHGRRGDLDRSQENAELPILKDALEDGESKTSIRTESIHQAKGTSLILHIARNYLKATGEKTAKTDIVFLVENRDVPFCKFDQINLNSAALKMKASASAAVAPIKMHLVDCLDLALQDNQLAPHALGAATLTQLRKDCAFAARFSAVPEPSLLQ